MPDDATLVALAVALSCADAPDSRAAAPAAGGSRGTKLELVATVRAKALRFDEVPRPDGILGGPGTRRATWKAERVNLPARPEPGVVYRDVEVRLTIAADAEELSAMLRESKRASIGVSLERVGTDTPAPAR